MLRRIITAVIAVAIVTLSFATIPNKQDMGKDLRECLEYVRNDSEYLYAPFSSIHGDNIVSFKRPEPLGDNVISGVYIGWMGHSPYWYSLLEKYGIEKYKDGIYLSLTDERVKIVCGNEKRLKQIVLGLEEHYGKEFEIIKEKEFGKYFICTLEEKLS